MTREADYTLLTFVASTNAAAFCVLMTIVTRSWVAGLLTVLFALLAIWAYRAEWHKLTRFR